MSVKMKRRLKQIDKMIEDFKGFAKQYPGANFTTTVHMLQDKRAVIADRIGKDNVHPKQKRP